MLPIQKIHVSPLFLFQISLPLSHRKTHTSDKLDLSNTVAVTEDNTDLRGSSTLLGELADLVNDLVGGGLEPRRGSTRVGDSRRGNALSLAVKTTHFGFFVVFFVVDGGEVLKVAGGCRRAEVEISRNGICVREVWVT